MSEVELIKYPAKCPKCNEPGYPVGQGCSTEVCCRDSGKIFEKVGREFAQKQNDLILAELKRS